MKIAPVVSLVGFLLGPGALSAQAGAKASCDPAALFSSESCRPPVFEASARVGGLDARAQLVLPGEAPVEYTVAIVGGGLVGHVAFTTEVWRAMCLRFRCALVHFDVEPQTRPTVQSRDPGRNSALGSGDALIALLDSLAKATSHPELARGKLALFGFSAAGSFAITFAIQHPERTLTAVRYHSHLRGLSVDTVALARVPLLTVASIDDSTAGVDDARNLWQAGSRLAAPWALAIESGRAHMSLDSWFEASDLIWRWIERLSKRPGPLSGQVGWFGDMSTRVISPTPGESRVDRSWLPDSVTAEAWRRLHKR